MKSASGEGGYERLSEQAAALPYAIFARPLPSASDPIAPQEAVNAAPDFPRIGVHKGTRAARLAPERCHRRNHNPKTKILFMRAADSPSNANAQPSVPGAGAKA